MKCARNVFKSKRITTFSNGTKNEEEKPWRNNSLAFTKSNPTEMNIFVQFNWSRKELPLPSNNIYRLLWLRLFFMPFSLVLLVPSHLYQYFCWVKFSSHAYFMFLLQYSGKICSVYLHSYINEKKPIREEYGIINGILVFLHLEYFLIKCRHRKKTITLSEFQTI